MVKVNEKITSEIQKIQIQFLSFLPCVSINRSCSMYYIVFGIDVDLCVCVCEIKGSNVLQNTNTHKKLWAQILSSKNNKYKTISLSSTLSRGKGRGLGGGGGGGR